MAILGIAIFTISCNKNKVIQEEISSSNVKKEISSIANCKVSLTEDMLAFESEEDLNGYMKFLESHSTTEIDKFERDNSFESNARKTENILKEYEILNEKQNVTKDEISKFRTRYADFVTFTDDDFDLKIEGLFNRVVNQFGYVQIGNVVYKFVGLNIYNTNIENIQELRNSNYSSNLISKATTQKVELKKSRVVNQWQNKVHNNVTDCGNKRDIKIDITFYATGPSTPAYGQSGNMFCSAGFSYKLKNRKRGWTGIWYGESRSSTNAGFYHASYNPYTNYSDYDYSVNVDRTYNARTWSAVWNNDPVGAQLWANGIFNNLWAYVNGTVTYDMCGTKTWTY